MPDDPRQAAIARLDDLIRVFRTAPDQTSVRGFIEETEALRRSITAFHMEGIRFRAFTLERRLARTPEAPPEAAAIFQDVKRSLEAAGFAIKSH